MIGDQVFRTRSSAELPGLAIVLAWAKAAGLLPVVRGRLVPAKKKQRLLDQPAALGYEYDVGDSWDHEVLLEKLVPAGPGDSTPRRQPATRRGCTRGNPHRLTGRPSPGTGHRQQLATAGDQAVRPEKDQVDEHR